jgi:histidyl-tRNA synthetase
MTVQPRTPPGVLELLPPQQIAHQRMLDTIRRGFERFGFSPIETPAFELSDVLLTKTGGETEKQVYYVQSTGALKQDKTPELALRFDLTVPLARYVAEHEHQLNFPFRRYQIQRVYRGERNQKGRYREFYQCDIDVIGKDTLALAYDAELPAVIYGIFSELAFGAFTIYINNRRLLRGLLESLGVTVDGHASVLHEIDRLGKQDEAEVHKRLVDVGMDPAKATSLLSIVTQKDADAAMLAVKTLAENNATLEQGRNELQTVYQTARDLGVPESGLKLNLGIARGLDYYTGTVYETFLNDHPKLGSICSGGRYDNLAEHYTKSKLPGVGISIGATRLFSQMLDMNLLGAGNAIAQVLVLQVEAPLVSRYAELGKELRAAGLNVEVYGSDDKLGKQLKYADRAKIPLAILLGSREAQAGVVKIKDLRATQEVDVPAGEVVARVKQLLG